MTATMAMEGRRDRTNKRKTAVAVTARKKNGKPSKAVVSYATPKTLIEVAYQSSRDPTVDVNKMTALIGIIAKREYDVAMLAAQNEMPRIVKDAWNPHTKSKYARLETMQLVVDPIARKHGFTISWGHVDSPLDDHYGVQAKVTHTSIINGEAISHTELVTVNIGMDTTGPKGGGTKSAAQGSGSSTAYGRRYALGMIFNLVIVGEDNDGAGAKQSTINQKQLDELTDLLNDDEIIINKFFTAYSINAIEHLPSLKFEEALARVKDAVKAKKAKEGKK